MSGDRANSQNPGGTLRHLSGPLSGVLINPAADRRTVARRGGPLSCVRIAEPDAALALVARLDDHAGKLYAE